MAIGAAVKLKLWAYPHRIIEGTVTTITPVAYERSRGRIEQRALTEREMLYDGERAVREQGKVVRVLTAISNDDAGLRTDMTGYAKIASGRKTLASAFLGWLARFFRVEVWSWIP